MSNDKPTAFVIMPFDQEFDPIYDEFLSPVLDGAGFVVYRASDIRSQQNILKDVIDGISKSDLIIADLTSENPNVFYELGLAHALSKPVILLTQSIDDVPFDLRSYRLLEYSTHFAKIEPAKKKLTELAKGFLNNSVSFGSPMTDFGQGEISSAEATPNESADSPKEDDRGYIDHLIDINEGYSTIAEILNGMTDDLKSLTVRLDEATEKLRVIGANPNSSSPAAARTVSRRLSEHISTFNGRLAKANSDFGDVAERTEGSLEAVMAFQRQSAEAQTSQSEEQMAQLREFRGLAENARDAQLNLASQMAELPRFERRLNREVTRGSEQVLTMAGNIDRILSSVNRALNSAP